MTDLRELYQELILDHSKRPRNRGKLANSTHHATGLNPLCGDQLELYLQIRDGRVADASFEGSGCAISTASASLLTESVKGLLTSEAIALFKTVQTLVTGGDSGDLLARFPKLGVFAGVSEFPARVKCASLAWHTLEHAIQNKHGIAKTEGTP